MCVCVQQTVRCCNVCPHCKCVTHCALVVLHIGYLFEGKEVCYVPPSWHWVVAGTEFFSSECLSPAHTQRAASFLLNSHHRLSFSASQRKAYGSPNNWSHGKLWPLPGLPEWMVISSERVYQLDQQVRRRKERKRGAPPPPVGPFVWLYLTGKLKSPCEHCFGFVSSAKPIQLVPALWSTNI